MNYNFDKTEGEKCNNPQFQSLESFYKVLLTFF